MFSKRVLFYNSVYKMDTVKSIRDRNKIVDEGYIYVKLKVLADNLTTVYECEQRRKGLCKAKIRVMDDNTVESLLVSGHSPPGQSPPGIKPPC